MSNEHDARNWDIVNLHQMGIPFTKIGKLFGITAQQAHLVYHTFLKTRKIEDAPFTNIEFSAEEYHELGYTIGWIARKLGMSPLKVKLRLVK